MLKYRTWNDITINIFNQIEDVYNDADLTNEEKDVKYAEIFTDKTENEILSLSFDDYNEIISEINAFLTQKIPVYRPNIKEININGTVFTVIKDVKELNVAQYVDFQSYIKSGNKAMASILSIFLIPKGKQYNEGYDITGVGSLINENLNIVVAKGLLDFFSSRLARSTKRSLTFWRWIMKMTMWKMGIPKKARKELNKVMKEAVSLIG